ncbi:aminoglycoside phosphotransferase family protein [Bacillus salacetis]|uniref:aminoglycoside phosphotransferase family protein n=1 Tax=Bacillus salacetis TaxID=2315464 RepID=UPI003BA1F350
MAGENKKIKMAEEWISEIMSYDHHKIEIIKSADPEFVLKVRTEKESFYFKSIGPAWAFESRLSEHLSKTYSGKTADIIAVHPTKPWMLMREIKGELLRKKRDKRVWQRALQEYAELQVQEVTNIQKLLALGVPDRGISVLKNQIDNHLEEMCKTGLEDEETKIVLALKPELLQLCEEMEGTIPLSLDHGDLHTANIYDTEGKLAFIDWGDASITHPFFSTRIFWNSMYELIDHDEEWLDMTNEFRPFYLEPWTAFASMDELKKLLRLSDQLGCLHRAVGWHLYTLPFQDIEEFKKRPAQWLQVLLEYRSLVKK